MDPDKFKQVVDSRLSEFFDGYVVIGFVAGTATPIMISNPTDEKNHAELNELLASCRIPGGQ